MSDYPTIVHFYREYTAVEIMDLIKAGTPSESSWLKLGETIMDAVPNSDVGLWLNGTFYKIINTTWEIDLQDPIGSLPVVVFVLRPDTPNNYFPRVVDNLDQPVIAG